jgi:hypothetical protein
LKGYISTQTERRERVVRGCIYFIHPAAPRGATKLFCPHISPEASAPLWPPSGVRVAMAAGAASRGEGVTSSNDPEPAGSARPKGIGQASLAYTKF